MLDVHGAAGGGGQFDVARHDAILGGGGNAGQTEAPCGLAVVQDACAGQDRVEGMIHDGASEGDRLLHGTLHEVVVGYG